MTSTYDTLLSRLQSAFDTLEEGLTRSYAPRTEAITKRTA